MRTTPRTPRRHLFREIDGTFFNAGLGGVVALNKITPEILHRLFDLNVASALFGAQALVPLMKPGSSNLITGSAAKNIRLAGAAVYSATKGAVRSMVRGMARELAGRSIHVNSVSPGPTETGFYAHAGQPAEQLDAFARTIAASNPLAVWAMHVRPPPSPRSFFRTRQVM